MNLKSITLVIILAILALALWLFFTPNQPRVFLDTGVATTVTPEVQTQVANRDDWPAPGGLAIFGHQVKLLAFSLPTNRFGPGVPIEVTLYWQTQPITNTYNLFLHLVDANNQLVSQTDMPLTTRTCAASSQFSIGIIETCDKLLLPDDLAVGEYQLLAGVYDPASGLRLTTPNDENAIALTSVEVDASTLTPVTTPLPPCPVTVPNGSTPPGEQPSPDHHGNGQLWTGLWPDGKVIFEPGGPGTIYADGSLGMKWWWWRGVEGQLAIEGRRLDAAAPPMQADIPEGYGQSGFQAAGLIFPTEGCWEVTGTVGEAELTFITLVVKVGESQ